MPRKLSPINRLTQAAIKAATPRNWSDRIPANSVLIIPDKPWSDTGGYRGFKLIAVQAQRDSDQLILIDCGTCDSLRWTRQPTFGIGMDVIRAGYVRQWSRSGLLQVGPALSSIELEPLE